MDGWYEVSGMKTIKYRSPRAYAIALFLSFLGMVATVMTPGTVFGEDLDLSAYRGKVVYVDFWASWCTPCRESFPWLSGLVQQYRSRNFVVIAVNVDHDRKLAERFLGGTPANFPVIYDPDGDIAASYKIVGMPSAVLIDRLGKTRFVHQGFSASKKDEYEKHVQILLAEPTH
jgi:thiol-disulfide isomerase/thioredoxin